jgi:uncharacterized membrane-anchored protein
MHQHVLGGLLFLTKLSPLLQVEATKFTEVGFHGRDVDQIIRDLVEAAITLQKQKVRSLKEASPCAFVWAYQHDDSSYAAMG